MDLITLKNWQAKRSGAKITIVGIDTRTGETAKVGRISVMYPLAGMLVAVDEDGQTYRLDID